MESDVAIIVNGWSEVILMSRIEVEVEVQEETYVDFFSTSNTHINMSTTDFSSSNLFKVDGLTAVITGAGSGLGLYSAQALAQNGCKVYILGRRLEVLQEAANRFNDNSKDGAGKLIPVQG